MPASMSSPSSSRSSSFDGERVSGFLYRPDRGALPRPPAADRQHPWRPRRPVAAGLPRPQQLSAQRARHRHLLSQCPRLDRLRQALRQPRQRPGAAREFGQGHRRLPRPARPRSGARSGPLRRHRRLLWRLYVLRLGDPLTASACAPPIASSPSPISSPSSKTPRAYRRDLRRVEYGDERDRAARRIARGSAR